MCLGTLVSRLSATSYWFIRSLTKKICPLSLSLHTHTCYLSLPHTLRCYWNGNLPEQLHLHNQLNYPPQRKGENESQSIHATPCRFLKASLLECQYDASTQKVKVCDLSDSIVISEFRTSLSHYFIRIARFKKQKHFFFFLHFSAFC